MITLALMVLAGVFVVIVLLVVAAAIALSGRVGKRYDESEENHRPGLGSIRVDRCGRCTRLSRRTRSDV